MDKPTFVYVVYIETTPEKLWEALLNPEFTRQYWSGYWPDCTWEVGASWKLTAADGKVWDQGEVLEIDPPRRLAVSWRHVHLAELQAIGATRATFDLEPCGATVKLTVTHAAPVGGEPFIAAVSNGWPHILSSLKSLLETGKALPAMSGSKADA